ncbi:VOC family protein [Undibacterium sp. TS12]|uniref:VOC family protein n=1 Tax=Undibacterium sp. TS12 TaxID=2908202 RepID=UPI001F4CD004|nr:VOC family protein [Undibacterium sp. TS12]
MSIYLEHANLTVPDIDQAIDFLQALEPGFRVRHDQTEQLANGQRRWVHVGNENVYIALQQAEPGSQPQMPRRTYENYGINHLGWVVDDLDAVMSRLNQRGYKLSLLISNEPFRRRAYYHDAAGFEWEMIQYLSDNNEERNAYESA